MTKVVSMARTSEYWISRARKNRLAGRYDEAMALLAKTREQYGTGEALERELAQTYDEMGCEEEAARAYLRVARMKGEYRSEALFQLALSAAQRAELVRAASYFDQFEKSDRRHVSPDLVEAAQIDGATSRQILFKIKLPMLMPSVTICTFLTLTNGFKMFDQNLSLTGGDPGKQSQLLALNIYDTFYARSGPQWKGIGQAKAVVFFILVIVIALIQLRATSSKEVQQ